MDVVNHSNFIVKNKMDSSIFAEFLNPDMCSRHRNGESTIASVARLDA